LLTPLAAVLVDRHRRDRILVAVCVIRAGALAGAALTVGLVSSPLPAYAFAAVATARSYPLPAGPFRPAAVDLRRPA
jgi:hypothetical protein